MQNENYQNLNRSPSTAPVFLGPWGCIREENLTPREVLRRALQHLLGHIPRYRLTERPLLTFTMRRSGSTLLLRLLYTQPGIDYINEPLNLWLPHPHLRRLPIPPLGKFISLTPEAEAQLAAYMSDLLEGRVRLRNQWHPLRGDYSVVVHRLVVKILNANALIDWFARRFNVDLLFFVRHPLAVAESLIRLGWPRIVDAYLEDAWFRDRYLSGERERLARAVLAHGSPWEVFTLEWCLENIHPLHVWQEIGAALLTYEDLVGKPEETVQWMAERFRLPEPERILRALAMPSRTAAADTKHALAHSGPRALLSRWRERIPPDEIAKSQEILDTFGITLYRAEDVYPKNGRSL